MLKLVFLGVCVSSLIRLCTLNAMITSMEYQAGNVLDKTYGFDESHIVTMHLNTLNMEAVQKIIEEDPDIVSLISTLNDRESSAFYEELKDRYAHFYKFAPENEKSPPLFVASKYEIDNAACTLVTESDYSAPFSFFDFLIKKGDLILGRNYAGNISSLEDADNILLKMNTDYALEEDKSLPFFFSESLSLFGSIKTKILLDTQDHPLAIQNTILNNRHTYSSWGAILCKKDTESRDGGYYGFSASRDWESKSSTASGEIGYHKETENGNFSAGVSGRVEKDDRTGETRTSTQVDVVGRF